MIKFFRRIRHRLLAENKLSKYLLYAMGEIILVVIGILVALQINNANELRKERIKEVNSLENLRADLLSEVENNTAFAQYRFEKAGACSQLLSIKEPATKEDVRSYTDTYEHVFIWSEFVPNNNTFKELLSSGNLSLIKNDSIKDRLLELQKLYAAVANGESHMRREYEAYLYDRHVENAMALGYFDLSTPTHGLPARLTIDDIPDSVHQQLIRDAKWQHNDPIFQNGLRLALMNNSHLSGMHRSLVEYIEELISFIDDDINR